MGRAGLAYICPMLSDLYSDTLLRAAADIPARRSLPDADASARKVSKVCGSEVEVQLKLGGGIVTDLAMDVSACALGQASASIFAAAAEGASAAEIRLTRDEMRAMLKEGGPPPSVPRFAALSALRPIADYPQRHASTLLVFEAAAECLDLIEAKRSTE